MSTVAEIRAAIEKLSPEEKALLIEELYVEHIGPPDDDPAVLASIDRGIADARADRVHTLDEVQEMMKQWISESRSQKTR
jgi:hypothetical protein